MNSRSEDVTVADSNSEASQPATETALARRGGRAMLLTGIALFVAPLVVYGVQLVGLEWMAVPWYIPILGTLGVCLMLLAIVRRFTLVRAACVLVFGLLVAVQWWYFLSYSVLPNTSEILAEGVSFPAFETTRADGTPFTSDDLLGQRTLLVFFRGRW